MRRKTKAKITNVYIPTIIFVILFVGIIFGIVKNTFKYEIENDNIEITKLEDDIFIIPNSSNNIEEYEYELYIVSEEIGLYELALKLNIDSKILAYNNPFIIDLSVIPTNTRLVVYREPIIFYTIQDGDTLETVASKFLLSVDELIVSNKSLEESDMEYKRYLIINNPKITDDILAERLSLTRNIDAYFLVQEQSTSVAKEEEIRNSNVSNNVQLPKNLPNKVKTTSNNRTSSTSVATTKSSIVMTTSTNSKTATEKVTKTTSSTKTNKLKGTFAGDTSQFSDTQIKAANLSGGRDILWPVNSNRITSEYGSRIHPIKKTTSHHSGLDIAAPEGTDVWSATYGVVTYAGTNGGYGKMIEIKRSDGLQMRYAHLSAINVSVGQSISEGDIIGKVGSTGVSTGPHLHFELLLNGESFDPLWFAYH